MNNINVKFFGLISYLFIISTHPLDTLLFGGFLSLARIFVIIILVKAMLFNTTYSFYFSAIIVLVSLVGYFAANFSVYGSGELFWFFSVHYVLCFGSVFVGFVLAEKYNVYFSGAAVLFCGLFFLFLTVLIFIGDEVFYKAWFTSENDLGSALILGFIYAAHSARGGFIKVILFIFSCAVAGVNSMRLAFGSLAIVWLTRRIFFAIIFILGIVLLFGARRLDVVPALETLIEPIVKILLLEPYGVLYGSLFNRVDAIIFGIKAAIDSYGLGIGPGNSINMIAFGTYGWLGSAQSLHNFYIQLICELGALGMFIVCSSFVLLYRRVGFFMAVAITFIMMTQSSGIFSNYLLLTFYGGFYARIPYVALPKDSYSSTSH